MALIQRNLIEALKANRKGLHEDLRSILADAQEIQKTKTYIPREARKEFTMDLLKVEMIVKAVRNKLNIKSK